MPRFVVWKSATDNLWYWHLKGANHEIVAQGQAYTRRRDAVRGIRRLCDMVRDENIVIEFLNGNEVVPEQLELFVE